MSHSFIAFLAALLCCPSFVWGIDLNIRDAPLPSYDYIIVGGGISGLVVANRLSEDPDKSILVLEAGDADNYEESIQVPQFVGADIGSRYDWKLSTVPQSFLDNITRPIPQGKALGGGSVLNAMCWNRGGANDYNAWETFGNPGWSWDGLLPYFIKSENYTPVFSKVISQEFSINYDPTKHGCEGPVHVSYPKFFYNQTRNFFKTLELLGVPTAFDSGDGTSGRACFIPTSLHPENQTRSDARRAYYDPCLGRPNLKVFTGQHVTRVLLEGANGGRNSSPSSGGLKVIGVEFTANETTAINTVGANIEVIVAAGALHSAQLLQLSGIGPKLLLDSQPDDQYLVADLDQTVVAGFSDQKRTLVRLLSSEDVGAYEIINNNVGSLTISIMHPFSRGIVEIGSSDPFEDPIIDPRYGSNPIDLQILVEALRFNRKILATPPMVELEPAQFVPPISADDGALMQIIKNGIRTEFHPCGTCAMLPLEKGGVVDSHLVVWGTQNLRIVDAGIFPLIPAAHLQATVYAVAEKAADIIKADYVAAVAELQTSWASTGDLVSPITVATVSSPVLGSDTDESETPVAADLVPASVPSPQSESHTAVGPPVHALL